MIWDGRGYVSSENDRFVGSDAEGKQGGPICRPSGASGPGVDVP
jgi:hypothetical protein